MKRTKYGYDVSVCDVNGNKGLRFEKKDDYGFRSSFLLTREDLEGALGLIPASVRIEAQSPLCCVVSGVSLNKKGV